ncbi:MAG TPA: hypothetical protein PKD10_14960 [Paracoccaceae bacterium]|nr:hypothetical protein [Paracoccaceae bacterium]
MIPVSPHPARAGAALILGAAIATLGATFAPALYYDAIEYRIFDLPPGLIYGRDTIGRPVTPRQIVEEAAMALVLFLIAKELWEALRIERGPFAGRAAVGPAAAVAGGMAGAALAWRLAEAAAGRAEEAAGFATHALTLGSDLMAAALFGALAFGARSAANQFLLFVAALGTAAGVLAAALVAPGGAGFRPLFLLLPAGAALAGWMLLTRPLAAPALTERGRARAGALWPWLPLAALSWVGVALAGLPPALGLVPIVPAMAHSHASFGLFAEAEGFLSDPLNRLARLVLPALPLLAGLFGLTHGGADLGALGPATAAVLAALWVGKTGGFALAALAAPGLRTALAARGIGPAQVLAVAALAAPALAGPALVMATVLPGGAVAEAARAGLGLSLVAGLALALALRGR